MSRRVIELEEVPVDSGAKLAFDPSLSLDLERLVQPMTAEEFLADYYSRSCCHVLGQPDKFSRLLRWVELNRILESTPLGPPQLMLYVSGAPVVPDQYVEYRTRDRTVLPRINVKGFTDQLRRGATMILNHIHELHPPLGILADSLERRFSARVGINLYAAWRNHRGYNLHRDPHDVFILQLSGRKRWLLHGHEGSASKVPSWDRILNQGDLLYIPRGEWHSAAPLDEPSLHLTISVENPTIPDFLSWLSEELKSSDLAQLSISKFSSSEDRSALLDILKKTVLDAIDAHFLDRYFESVDSRRGAPVRFSLPWSATPEALPPDAAATVRLRSRRAPSMTVDEQDRAVILKIGSKTWRFPLAMRNVLEVIRDGRDHSVEELVSSGSGVLGSAMTRAFLATLVKEGILARSPNSD